MTARAMGLTVAIPASYVTDLTPADRQAMFHDLAEQALPALRVYVGGAPPQGPVSIKVDGPVDDALQGMIYALSLAAPFNEADIPADCDAYLALRGAVPSEPVGYVQIEGDGHAS